MPDALQQALDNAAYNAPKGSELHLENLDSIADPSQDEIILDQYDPSRVVIPKPPQYPPRDVAFNSQPYLANISEQDSLLLRAIKDVAIHVDGLHQRMTFLFDDISKISTIINTAAQSMPQEPTLSHRSLEEWPDTTLLNELVNRENDLMPFYFELLKRIGSPELQSLVMSSMQGKNNSMVTLAQLCAAMGSMSSQPQSQPQQYVPPQEEYSVVNQLAQARSEAQRQLTQPTAEDYARANKNPDKYGTPTYPIAVLPQRMESPPQYFGQATEEYIRKTNNGQIYS